MKYIIDNPTGKYSVDGSIYLQGAKNAMLNNLLLPMLTTETCVISNVPNIKDVELNLNFLKTLNAKVVWLDNHTVSIQCDNLKYNELDIALSAKTTSSKYFIPFMVNRFGSFSMGPSGGDKIGERGFENYANSLMQFGIHYTKKDSGTYYFYKINAHLSEYRLPFQSIGLTINAIYAALTGASDIVLQNACIEPEIDNTIDIINQMGGDVERSDEYEITVRAKKEYYGGKFRNMSDRNAAVTYAVMALITNSTLEIRNYDNAKMDAFYSFLKTINATFEVNSDSLVIHASTLIAPTDTLKVKAFIYPDIHSDWQPVIAPLLTQLPIKSYIEEYLFPDRLQYWKELEKMGAVYEYDYSNQTRFPNDGSPHAVNITGKAELRGGEVSARDLRAGAALVIASLVAKGRTSIDNAHEIERGYENMTGLLQSLGIDITRVE